MNLELDPVDEAKERLYRTVVRVRTSAWATRRGLSVRRDVSFMRKLSGPQACLLEEEISAVGADLAAQMIVNLDSVEDGLYTVIACNERRDWETGVVDDYDLKLIPYTP